MPSKLPKSTISHDRHFNRQNSCEPDGSSHRNPTIKFRDLAILTRTAVASLTEKCDSFDQRPLADLSNTSQQLRTEIRSWHNGLTGKIESEKGYSIGPQFGIIHRPNTTYRLIALGEACDVMPFQDVLVKDALQATLDILRTK